jgi:hypothetical protein
VVGKQVECPALQLLSSFFPGMHAALWAGKLQGKGGPLLLLLSPVKLLCSHIVMVEMPTEVPG